MADWMWLCMPVRVIDKRCKECPELEVTNSTEVLWADGEKVSAENNLECRHMQRCLFVRNMIEGSNQ